MKVLFLAIPFSGVDSFADTLAQETICRYDSDPMKQYDGMPLSKVWNERNKGMYVHPQNNHSYSDIPDRTFMTHMVGIHPLPYNLTEQDFMDQLKQKFDTVICMVPRNIETNWKRWCAINAINSDLPGFSNMEVKESIYKSCGENLYRYEDSMYDQDIVDKITNSYNELNQFANENSGIRIVHPEDIIGTEIENRIEVLNTEIGQWGIDSWQSIQRAGDKMEIVKHAGTLQISSEFTDMY